MVFRPLTRFIDIWRDAEVILAVVDYLLSHFDQRILLSLLIEPAVGVLRRAVWCGQASPDTVRVHGAYKLGEHCGDNRLTQLRHQRECFVEELDEVGDRALDGPTCAQMDTTL